MFVDANHKTLLHITERKRYVHISPLGAEIIKLLTAQPDLNADDLTQQLIARYPTGQAQITDKLGRFLAQLEQVGAFTSSPDSADEPAVTNSKLATRRLTTDHLIRKISQRPMFRIRLWSPNRPIARPLVERLHRVEGRTIKRVIAGWLVLMLALVIFAFTQLGLVPNQSLLAWPVVLGVIVLHLIGHELCHAVTGSYFGVKVRELGVALLYYFIPVGYADHTDNYHLNKSSQKAYIALAGPAFDLSAAALSGLIACASSGWVAATFHALFLLQLTTFAYDLNPLMPSDGYHAVEAGFGELNFRRRSFTLLFKLILRQRLEDYLATLSQRQRVLRVCYAVFSLIYIALLFGGVVSLVFKLLSGANGGGGVTL